MAFNFKKQSFTLFFLLFAFYLNGQISEGGQPFSFFNKLKKEPLTYNVKSPTINEINVATNFDKGPYCIGILRPVKISSKSDGSWTTNQNGYKVWRVKIKSKGAIGLSLHYKKFFIPNGGEVFIYNKNKNHVIGKFTSNRNKINFA